MNNAERVAHILSSRTPDDADVVERLFPLLYDELRSLAERLMERDAGAATLQPTALVHEAYLKLVRPDDDPRWNDDAHFFMAAAQAMRHILVDRQRRGATDKHGGAWNRVSFFDAVADAPAPEGRAVRVSEALERLEARDPPLAKIVTLRFFGGLTVPEVAQVLGYSERTVKRQWTFARAWLIREIGD